MKTSISGIRLIKHYESLHDGDHNKIGLQPKMCPAGIWTIGYGRALRGEGGNFLVGDEGETELKICHPEMMNITEEDANLFLKEDLVKFENIVNRRLRTDVTQDQFDALVSHTYNTGGSDTMFKLVNRKASKGELENWFTLHYVTANGKWLRGLQNRRVTEWKLFNEGILDFDA